MASAERARYDWVVRLGRFLLLSVIAVAALPYACSSSENGSGSLGFGGTGGASSPTAGGQSPSVTIGSGGGSGGGGVDDLACVVSKKEPMGLCVMVTPGSGGSSGASGGGGPGATSSSSSSSSTSTGTGMGGSDGGGGSACSHVFSPSACADCVVQNCCDETLACEQVQGCFACFVQDPSAMGCGASPIYMALANLEMCEMNACGSACKVALEYHCNPVTNFPCNTAKGYACDLSGMGSFECFPPPNTQKLCESCSVTNMRPYCEPGLHCVEEDAGSTTGFCGRYCCEDTECCPDDQPKCGNRCDHNKLLGPGPQTDVGICTSG